MSRRRRAKKREYTPDPRHNSTLVSHLVNVVMLDGKKSVAKRLSTGHLSAPAKSLRRATPSTCFSVRWKNVRPKLEVKSRRVAVRPTRCRWRSPLSRQQSLAFRWLINAQPVPRRGSMSKNLGDEIIDAYNNTGSVVKKKGRHATAWPRPTALSRTFAGNSSSRTVPKI